MITMGKQLEQRIFKMALYNKDDEKRINEFLEDGWLVKDIQSASSNDLSCAVVLLERLKAE